VVDEKFDWNTALGMNSQQSAGQRMKEVLVTLFFILIGLIFVVALLQDLSEPSVPTGGCDPITGWCEEPEFP
jgi:hypothetical protein